jgi:hypothetical protein
VAFLLRQDNRGIMSKLAELFLAAYVVVFIIDILHSYHKYENHKLFLFDKPTKSWFKFFVEDHKWTLGTTVTCVLVYQLLVLLNIVSP